MLRKFFVALCCLIASGVLFDASAGNKSCKSQLQTTYLNADWLESMHRENARTNPATSRLRDIVQTVGFSNAALNRKILKDHNTDYTLTLARGLITSQHGSGRCWIFAATNMLRSMMLREDLVDIRFEFSENYIWFYHFLEQSNSYIEDVIQSRGKDHSEKKIRQLLTFGPSEGGWFQYFAFLVSKYGLVPKDAMPETVQSYNPRDLIDELTREMTNISTELHTRVFKSENIRLETLRKNKAEWMNRIARILSTHLGNPPTQFNYRHTSVEDSDLDSRKMGSTSVEPAAIIPLTPKMFAEKVAQFNPDDYVTIAVNPLLDSNKLYQVRDSKLARTAPGEKGYPRKFINVSPGQLEKAIYDSLRKQVPVWAAVTISKDVEHETGIMHPDIYDRKPLYGHGPDLGGSIDVKEGIYHGFYSPEHAVLINGIDWPSNLRHPIKYRIENSWGPEFGTHGIYHGYREWMLKYCREVVVNKATLSKKLRDLLDTKPELIAPQKDY